MKQYYQNMDPDDWQGRADANPAEYFYQIIQPLNLLAPIAHAPGFALLGFHSDAGVKRNFGRTGAAQGASFIKRQLARLAIQQPITIYDAGYIFCPDDDLENAQHALGQAVCLLLQNNMIPIVLGGGHETAWGHYQGLAAYLQQQPLSIINFDAHFDLRELKKTNYGTSGTPFQQIAQTRIEQNLAFDYTCIGIQRYSNTKALFNIANDLKVNYLLAEKIHEHDTHAIKNFLNINALQKIYLSLCLDVFAAHIAPGVSAPQPLGLSPQQILPSLRELARSGKILSFDIVELAPNLDIDHHTAKLAAQLLCEFLHCFKGK